MKESPKSTKLGDVVGVVFNDINRCYKGCQMKTGVNTTYTGLEEQETLIDMENNIFCESTNSEADYILFFGDCWIRKFTMIRQKILHQNSKISTPATDNLLPVSWC